jgi:hypothetical protein
MIPHSFQADRSDALRQQLVQLPAAEPHRLQTRSTRLNENQARADELPSAARKHWGLQVAASTLAGGLVIGALALALTPEDRSEDPSRVIPALAHQQEDADKLPARALPALGGAGIDPSQTRLLGHSATTRYYGAPGAGNSTAGAPAGKTICIIPVTAAGASNTLGCTLLKTFESYGLKIETPDRTEAGWLVVPAAVEASLESVKDETGWLQQGPNFLVRNNR